MLKNIIRGALIGLFTWLVGIAGMVTTGSLTFVGYHYECQASFLLMNQMYQSMTSAFYFGVAILVFGAIVVTILVRELSRVK